MEVWMLKLLFFIFGKIDDNDVKRKISNPHRFLLNFLMLFVLLETFGFSTF